MKQVKNLSPDKINSDDQRFDFQVIKSNNLAVSANSLPLFWKENGEWIPCTDFSFSDDEDIITALVYSDNVSYEDALKEKCSFLELNIFDIARVLLLLEKHAESFDKKVWSEFLSIPLKDWDRIKALDEMAFEWKMFFVSKNTPLKRVFTFSDEKLRSSLKPLLSLNPGINILEQIATLLKEISLRDDLSYISIMQMDTITSILAKDEKSAVKLNTLRQVLSEKRYPLISEYRMLLKEKSAELEKLSDLSIGVDENFETSGIQVKYIMKDLNDIDSLEQWLKHNKKSIEAIFELQKGELK